MKKKSYNNENDVSDLILNLWDYKSKIILIITAFLFLGFLYYFFTKNLFTATTNIKPISTFENEKYKLYNAQAGETVINFNSENLLNLFIDKIMTETLIEKGIIKNQLLSIDDFQDKNDYEQEIKRTAILIIDKMISPIDDKNGKNIKKNYWQYKFEIKNKKNWVNFLKYIEKTANDEIRENLINRFNTDIEILNIDSKFKLEDIEQNIQNELEDYKTQIKNRLAFLKEQAEIARTLNIAQNTLEVENFQTDNAIVTNIKSENSYYLKGYEMIEKEISLINSRENEKAFVSNLFELEKTKRSILQSKKTERLKFLFLQTPINNKNDFVAAKIDYIATKFKPKLSLLKISAISIIVGFMVSLIYIFFNISITSRK